MIKKFEDIDWDDFDFEEKNNKGQQSILKKDLTDYFILYDDFDKYKLISKKLKDLGYDVFYSSDEDYDEWEGFFYDDDDWVQSLKIFFKDFKKLTYDEIKDL